MGPPRKCVRCRLGPSASLHLAAGIVLGVVALELMPEALAVEQPWVPLLAFTAGGVAFVGLDGAIGYVRGRLSRDAAEQDRAMTISPGWLSICSAMAS